MKIYKKEWKQTIPGSLDEIWNFFSRPENLDELTPKDMKFQILTDIKDRPMYEGMLIQYKVSPLLNIKMNWTTEITNIKDKSYFIDQQRFGPYQLWHHQHHFKEVKEGILMTDILHYAIGYSFIGNIANALFVSGRIQEIFDYRYQKVEELFANKKVLS